VEDCLQCEINEPLVLFISPQHPSFQNGWLSRLATVYDAFPTSALQFHEGGIFFSVEVEVVKNPMRELLVAGGYNVTSFLELFSFRGGSSLALRFLRVGIDGFELKFADIFYSLDLIQIWGIRKDTRDLKGQLKKMLDPGRRSAMFQRYLSELYGDRASTKYLCSSFAHLLDIAGNDIDLQQIRDGSISGNKIVKTFSYQGKAVSLDLPKSKFAEFEAFVESSIERSVLQCYGHFVTLTSPIISQADLNSFVKKLVELMPQQFLVLWTMLNFSENTNLPKRSHLQAFYLRMVLYQFIAMNRIRNSKTFTWWALCNAAARYGSHDVQARSNLAVHYGISITQCTLQRKLAPFNDYGILMKACETKLASSGHFGIAVWDNSQLVTPLKFQRGGRSSVSSKVTSRIFVKPYDPSYGTTTPACLLTEHPGLPVPVVITYLDQPVPSPVGMVCFEQERDPYLQIKHIEDDDSSLEVEATGVRVEAYMKLVLLCDELVTQKRLISIEFEGLYQEQPTPASTEDTLSVSDHLQPNRSYEGFYHSATNFQRRSTRKWRKDPPRATVLAPPVSPDDETTTRGAGKVILSILLLFGLLEATDSTAIEGNVLAVKLPLDYKKRWLVLVGDGLSQMRLQAFKDMLDSSSYSFEKRYESAQLLSKAMDQCVALPGDLHGGAFIFL
jgi:hypothetical protein